MPVKTSLAGFRGPRLRPEGPGSPGITRGLPALGFLVVDSMFTPLSANHEAIEILTYNGKDKRPQNLAEAFNDKIRRHLARGKSLTAIAFISGRRTYFCRAFRLDGKSHPTSSTTIVMVLERGISGNLALGQVAEQFRLTRREREAVTLLLRGLSNKEMAERMSVSANTIKALLRLVMVKMSVSSRAAIVSKVLDLMLSVTPKDGTSPSGEWKSASA